MEKKQTAVEWLVKEIENLITIDTFKKWIELKEQAKEMEKEQIYYAYQQGLMDVIPMDYYNNTFKSE